ncbi:hypothetical protein QQ054_00490 [Oscillatoria amoena NRMC-F 0135]|nr:hypothetical protein [Oscillatoria amoena NRMC-F 0135]
MGKSSEEEELRKFFEALGLPVEENRNSPPPPPVFEPEPPPVYQAPPPPPPKPREELFPRPDPAPWSRPPEPAPAQVAPPPPPVPSRVEPAFSWDQNVTLPKVTSQSVKQAESSIDRAARFMEQNVISQAAYALDSDSRRKKQAIADHPLRKLLSDKSSLRNAVLLREVLGPPKALQS